MGESTIVCMCVVFLSLCMYVRPDARTKDVSPVSLVTCCDSKLVGRPRGPDTT